MEDSSSVPCLLSTNSSDGQDNSPFMARSHFSLILPDVGFYQWWNRRTVEVGAFRCLALLSNRGFSEALCVASHMDLAICNTCAPSICCVDRISLWVTCKYT